MSAREMPRLDASKVKVGYVPVSSLRLRRRQPMQNLELGHREQLDQRQHVALSGVRRGFLAAYQLILELLPVDHAGRYLDRAQRVKEFLVGHSASPSLGRDSRSVGGPAGAGEEASPGRAPGGGVR